MRVAKYKYAIIGALFGIFLSLVLPYLEAWMHSDTLARLKKLYDTFSERQPGILAFVLAALFAALFPFLDYVWRLFKKRVAEASLIGMLFNSDPEVNVLIPHMSQTDFERVDTHDRITLPVNCPFLPATHGIAMGKLTEHVNELFSGTRRVVISYDQSPPADLAEHDFIVMGGPFVNRMGRSLLDHYSNSYLRDFALTGTGANDVAARYSAAGPFTALIDQNHCLTRDYGFVIVVPSHLNARRRACFMFGLWPQGTMAAVDALVTAYHPPQLAKAFRRSIRKRKPVLAVVNVVVTGLVDGRCTFERVFELPQT